MPLKGFRKVLRKSGAQFTINRFNQQKCLTDASPTPLSSGTNFQAKVNKTGVQNTPIYQYKASCDTFKLAANAASKGLMNKVTTPSEHGFSSPQLFK